MLYFGYFPLRAELFPPDGSLFLLQGRPATAVFEFVLPAFTAQGGVHLCNGILPVAVRHFGGFDGGAASLIVADACVGIASPVAGGDDRVIEKFIVPSRYAACGSGRAADSPIGMIAGGQGTLIIGSRYAAYIDGAASATGHAAPGIAGFEGAGCVTSHHAADKVAA